MADWWDSGSTDFNLGGFDPTLQFPDFGQFSFPDYSFPSFDFNFPTFDPGQFDLGFNPQFDLGQYAPALADPFAIPTGDLNLPNFDLTSMLAQEPTFNTGDFNPSLNTFGSYNFTPTSFGDVPALSSSLQDLGQMGNSIAGGVPNYMDPGENLFSPGGLAAARNEPTVDPSILTGSNTGGGPVKDARDEMYKSVTSANKLAPWLSLGQLGLGLGGSLAGALAPTPQRKITDFEKQQAAEANAIARDKLALEREQMAMQAEMQQAALDAQAGMNSQDNATAEALKRHPLFGTDPRFSSLYNDVTGAAKGLSPDSPQIQQMTQEIYSTRLQAATQEFDKQRAAVLENANRLGVNPAQQLSDIDAAQQKALQALFVEAQQQALAFAQARLDPANQLLQSILKTVV